jgi:tetrahydromethanopterin S-methyltransferase subunit D
MPDFEALVRHQQTSRKPATERLKVVEKLPISIQAPTTDGKNLSTLFFGLIGGLFGSIIGTALIFYLSAKELIDFKILF